LIVDLGTKKRINMLQIVPPKENTLESTIGKAETQLHNNTIANSHKDEQQHSYHKYYASHVEKRRVQSP